MSFYSTITSTLFSLLARFLHWLVHLPRQYGLNTVNRTHTSLLHALDESLQHRSDVSLRILAIIQTSRDYSVLAYDSGMSSMDVSAASDGKVVKMSSAPVAFLTSCRPQVSIKFPATAARSLTYASNDVRGHEDPGPDAHPGTGTTALLICLSREQCRY